MLPLFPWLRRITTLACHISPAFPSPLNLRSSDSEHLPQFVNIPPTAKIMENRLKEVISELGAAMRNLELKLNQVLSFGATIPGGGANSNTIRTHQVRGCDQVFEGFSNEYNTISILKTRRNGLVDINRLPPEILGGIIRLTSTPSSSQPYPYWRFISVCRHWRDVILDDTGFWSVISLTPGMTADSFHTIVQRSKDRKLDVRVITHSRPTSSEGGTQNTDVDFEEVIPLLSFQSHRIENLYFFGPSPTITLQGPFPSLRKLAFDPGIPDQQSSKFSSFLQGCPSLEILMCPFINMDLAEVHTLKPIWRNLQRLDLNFGSNDDVLHLVQLIAMLSSCLKLKTLRVCDSHSRNEIVYPKNASITLPSLSVLITNIYPLLHTIHAPQLSVFGIIYQPVVDQRSDNVLNDFDFSKISCLQFGQKPDDIWMCGGQQSSNFVRGDSGNRWCVLAPVSQTSPEWETHVIEEDIFPNHFARNGFHVSMPSTALSFDRMIRFVTIMCNLKEFAFYYLRPISPPKRAVPFFVRVLRSVSSISTLKLATQGSSKSVLPSLLKHLRDASLCPRLEVLVLEDLHNVNPYEDLYGGLRKVLSSVFKSRKARKVRLIKEVTLIGCTGVCVTWIAEGSWLVNGVRNSVMSHHLTMSFDKVTRPVGNTHQRPTTTTLRL